MRAEPAARPLFGAAYRLLVALFAGALSACVFPLAPYEKESGYYGSRSGLERGVPALVLPGRTPRAEVVRLLGAAEVEAPDGQWAYYESNYVQSESGIWMLFSMSKTPLDRFPRHNSLLLRRLFVHYDDAGIVADVQFNTEQCKDAFEFLIYDAKTLERCALLRRDVEIRAERQAARMRQAVSGETKPVHWFENALWKEASSWSWFVGSGIECRGAQDRTGLMGVSSRNVVFLPREYKLSGPSLEPLRIARSQIASAQAIYSAWPFRELVGIRLKIADGKDLTVSLCRQEKPYDTILEFDPPRIDAALSVLAGSG